MQQMRIVIPMLYYYPDRPSGSVRLAFDEAVYLAQMGHEVWVVTQDAQHNQPEYAFRDGLHVLQYPSPKVALFDPRRMQIHQHHTRDLLRGYVKDRVDVVHGHSLLHYDGALSLYGGIARCCYSVHSPVKMEMEASSRGSGWVRKLYYTINGQLNHRVEYRCLSRSDVITSDSTYTKTLLGQLHSPAIARQTQVVPGWVDVERFQIIADRDAVKRRFGWRTDVPLLFTLRRLVPRNGVDRLLHALHMVKSAGHSFQMVIGGSGLLRPELEALAAELGLSDDVRFLGYISDDELPLMYGAADVFILPTSELECFGLIMLEALATGRPVLATPVGAIPEVLEQVEPAWLARDATPQAIADIIVAHLTEQLPHHEPETLRSPVVERYAREQVIRALVDVALGVPQPEKAAR